MTSIIRWCPTERPRTSAPGSCSDGSGISDFQSCLISNNQKPRVEMFNREIGTKYICNAHKPSTKNYIRAMELMGTDRSNTVFVGDQLFTDVWGAKRAGIRNILVKPIHPKEEIQIVLKRRLERIVLHFYKKGLKNKGN